MKLLETTIGILAHAVAAAVFSHGLSAAVTMSRVAEYDMDVKGCGGITYLGGNQYYVLRDHDESGKAKVYPVTIDHNASTAAISAFTFGTPITPGELDDSEGIAFDPGRGTIWISDEKAPSIREYYDYGMPTGREAPVPQIQMTCKRSNRSLEALTISGDGLVMWTCNEQALSCDGPLADGTADVNTVVRLTRFERARVDDDWRLAGQWAYRCDRCQDTESSQSGLCGLCALPDGSVLALEREVDINTYGRCRVYRVTPSAIAAATDVSSIAALADASYTAVDKGPALIDFNNYADRNKYSGIDWPMIVYEGICLGPRLSNGDLAVYLVSDGGERKEKSFFFTFVAYTLPRFCALRLSGLDVVTVNCPSPAGGTAVPSGVNYRYLNGSTVTVGVSAAGLEPTAYTNNGATVTTATWSAGGASGVGPSAQVVLNGDTTFDWTLDTSGKASTEIGSNDSFEGFAEGTLADAMPSWSGEGAVESFVYSPPVPPGYSMPRESHSKVLNILDEPVARSLSSNIAGNRHLDIMVEMLRPSEPLNAMNEGSRLAVAADPEGHLCLWHLKPNGGSPTAGWTRLGDAVYSDGVWLRIGIDIEDGADGSYCRVKVNGSVCPSAEGYRNPSLAVAEGPWYRLVSGSAATLREVSFSGSRLDDILITTDRFPAEHTGPTSTNGVEFAWFDRVGLPRDPDAAAPRLHGRTVRYLYQSGVEPYSDKPLAITGLRLRDDGGIDLDFNGYKGDSPGTAYSVYRSADLEIWDELKPADGRFEGDGAAWSTSWMGMQAPGAGPWFYKVEAK